MRHLEVFLEHIRPRLLNSPTLGLSSI
jgi:hypothetical protein